MFSALLFLLARIYVFETYPTDTSSTRLHPFLCETRILEMSMLSFGRGPLCPRETPFTYLYISIRSHFLVKHAQQTVRTCLRDVCREWTSPLVRLPLTSMLARNADRVANRT